MSILLQLICKCIWIEVPGACREAGGFGRTRARQWRKTGRERIKNKVMSATDRTPRLPADLQPAGMVQSCRPIGRADRAGRSPDRGGAAARRRRRPDRPAADRADAAVHPVCDPRRPARRPHLAALADGGLRSPARRGAGRHPPADLARSADAAAARAAWLCRGLRNGRL